MHIFLKKGLNSKDIFLPSFLYAAMDFVSDAFEIIVLVWLHPIFSLHELCGGKESDVGTLLEIILGCLQAVLLRSYVSSITRHRLDF